MLSKKISVLHPQIKNVGGAMKQMLHLAEYLSSNNKVSFYCFLGATKEMSQNYSFSMNSSFSSYPLKLLSFFIIAWQIRKSDYVICGNSPMHFVVGLSKILFRSKAKTIWWHHHYPWYFERNTGIKTYFKKIIERYFVQKVDTIVGNSRFLQEKLQKIYKRETEVLFPLIDSIFYEKNNPKPLASKKILFAAGRWERGKGLVDIESIYTSLKKSFDFELVIAGIGAELEKFESIYKNTEDIHFLGQLSPEEMKYQFQKTDIFLFPSQIDSFGLVIIESFLSGTPVIGYDRGEASYIIQDGINGYLVKNREEYIQKLKTILLDEGLLKDLQNGARKSIISNYSMKHFETQLAKIIFEK